MYKISMQKVVKILRVIREDPNNGISHVSRLEDSIFEKCQFSPNKPQAQRNPNQNLNKWLLWVKCSKYIWKEKG